MKTGNIMMLWPLYKTYAINLSQFYDRKFVSLSRDVSLLA